MTEESIENELDQLKQENEKLKQKIEKQREELCELRSILWKALDWNQLYSKKLTFSCRGELEKASELCNRLEDEKNQALKILKEER
ncbi:MAG: hypothetical protein ACOCQD_00385 [archaeon]